MKLTPKINQIIIKEIQKILKDCSRSNRIRVIFLQLFQIRGPQQAFTDKISQEKARPFQDQGPKRFHSHLKLIWLQIYNHLLEMWARNWEIWDMGPDLRANFQVCLQLLKQGLHIVDLGSVLDAKIYQQEDHRLFRQTRVILPSNKPPMLQALGFRNQTQISQTWPTSLKVTLSTYLCDSSTCSMLRHTQIKQKTLYKVKRVKIRNLRHLW